METVDDTKRIEAGIDWLTVTAPNGPVADTVEVWMGKAFADVQGTAGSRDWFPGYGYQGWKTEHAGLARRHDGVMVVVSSWAADKWAPGFLVAGGRASRVDVQVTVAVGKGVGARIEQVFDAAKRGKGAGGRPAKVMMYVGRDGPEGLTIGSRKSERYMRVYDKGKESGDTRYEGWLRYEVEYKGATAARCGTWILEKGLDAGALALLVRDEYVAKGVRIGEIQGLGSGIIRAPRRAADADSRMEWLRTQVSPTVMKMIERVGPEKVLGALLGAHFDEKLLDEIVWENVEYSGG